MMIRICKTIAALLFSISSYAQGYVDQVAIYPISESQRGDIANIRRAQWITYRYTGNLDTLNAYLNRFPGNCAGNRRYIIELANRITFDNLQKGRLLFVPVYYEEDYRAYTPYPFQYDIAASLPKLFVIDKYTQTFAAYEYGKLVRWGLVSTGRKNELTPQGRYNFNWKAYYKKSTAAPPGEVWEMYWVFDFHARFGIHVHQYQLPIGAAVSHGCVRTAEADAVWNYNWANQWVHDKKGNLVRNGTPVMVINANPKGRPAQWKLVNNDVVSQVQLPAAFSEVRAGTVAQKQCAWESGW